MIAEPTRAGLAVDRLPGDFRKRFLDQPQFDSLYLKQPLVLFHQRILGLKRAMAILKTFRIGRKVWE